jgi:hypothetical protein
MAGERRADAAGTLNEGGSPCEVIRPEDMLEAAADPVIDAEGRRQGGVP